MEYSPPYLTLTERKDVGSLIERFLRTNGMKAAPKLIASLALENARLVKECNDLRLKLGISTYKTFGLEKTE